MRAAPSLLMLAMLFGACGGGSSTSTPTPIPTSVPEPSARELLALSDEAMNRLISLRVNLQQRSTVTGNTDDAETVVWEYQAPDRARYTGYGGLSIIIGSSMWKDASDGTWTMTTGHDAFRWPQYDRLAPSESELGTFEVTDARIEREETIDGQEAWVITYTRKEPSIEGPFDLFFTDWIAKDSLLLLRSEQYDNDPFGARYLFTNEYDYEEPVSIEPPP